MKKVGLGIRFPHELGEEGSQEGLRSRHTDLKAEQEAALWASREKGPARSPVNVELSRCFCRIERKPKRLKHEQVRAGGERPEPGRGRAGQGKEFGSYSEGHRKLWGCLRI